MSRLEGLKANSSQFTLEGEPFRILGGSVHYFRVPRAYWEDRLLKMKACGLNTLTTYVPWNLHEPERGTFNFQDQLDLKAYVSLAAQLGLWVILRPGPYICAEWDLGGLPSWLLQDEEMKLRTTYPGFVNAVNLYFDKLISVIKPLMFEGGGPIIAVQVENEYGSFAKDDKYMPFIKNCLQSRGIKELLMTSDNWEGLRCGGVEGALKTINLQRLSFGAIQHLADIQPQKPLMVMEYWSGWFDVWGEHHHVFHAEGLQIGSNGFLADYDAPLSEAGDCTPKYHHLRNLFSQYHSEPLPGVPSSPERKAYSPAFIQQHLSLWDVLQFSDKVSCRWSDGPVNMENLPVNNNNGQSYGYTLYETTITGGGALNSRNNIRDRAMVFVNRECVGCLDYKTHEVALPDGKGERTLSFLVENCGRVNYGKALDEQRKGIVGDIVLNNTPLRGFSISCFDMKPSFIKRSVIWIKTSFLPKSYSARLCVDGPPKDTFCIYPQSWGKGVIFVNGQNLGRYWFIGPQHFLYLPAPWLRSGENEIIVFEEQRVHDKLLFAENPDYGKVIDVYKLPFCTLL
uniref:Si:dkey-224e22.2 n=1 Tax=Neolamprologus brichardi TaxID=32507 RepID=A0A3Q4HY88_NEOBR